MGVAMGLAFALILILMDPSGIATLINHGGNQGTAVFVGTIVLTFGIGATLTGVVFIMTEDDEWPFAFTGKQISGPPRDETDHFSNDGWWTKFLSHAARHEAPDWNLIVKPYRPNHRASRSVRFGDHGVVRNIDPIVVKADPVMAVFRFPIGVGDAFTIRHGAAESLAAGEMIEPRFKRWIGVAAIKVASRHATNEAGTYHSKTKGQTKHDALHLRSWMSKPVPVLF
jgi:hypothetical protein